jgi:hypothetical protein
MSSKVKITIMMKTSTAERKLDQRLIDLEKLFFKYFVMFYFEIKTFTKKFHDSILRIYQNSNLLLD